MPRPSAYGVHMTGVTRLEHPKRKRWYEVTWSKDGQVYSARTVPGYVVNIDIDSYLDLTSPIDIILNGRGQIIYIQRKPV